MKTILIVDDDTAVAEVIAMALEHAGYRVITAHSGQNARDVLAEAETAPDLILTDFMMPLMTGPEMVRAMRASGAATIPVILMSAVADDAHRECPEMFAALLQKPFRARQLLAIVAQLLGPERPSN